MTLCKHRLEMTNYDHWKLVQCTKPSRGTPGMGEIPIKKKVPAGLGIWVYNSENRFVGSFYQNTCCVKPANQLFEKKTYSGTP